jgi:hypothetical protein
MLGSLNEHNNNFTITWNLSVLQFIVHTNETTQMDESLIDNKIINPLKESVSEVEKLVRAGVYKELHFNYTCLGSCFNENLVVIV